MFKADFDTYFRDIYRDKIYQCITSQPKASRNTQRCSTQRAGQNMQPTKGITSYKLTIYLCVTYLEYNNTLWILLTIYRITCLMTNNRDEIGRRRQRKTDCCMLWLFAIFICFFSYFCIFFLLFRKKNKKNG